MDKMAASNPSKSSEVVVDPPGFWITDVERFRYAEEINVKFKSVTREAAGDIEAGKRAWTRLEVELERKIQKCQERLRDRIAPRVFRQMSNMLDLLDDPERITNDSHSWGHLGVLDAATALYVQMRLARTQFGQLDRALPHIGSMFAPYRGKAYSKYEAIRLACAEMTPHADPSSLSLAIAVPRYDPLLMKYFNFRSDRAAS